MYSDQHFPCAVNLGSFNATEQKGSQYTTYLPGRTVATASISTAPAPPPLLRPEARGDKPFGLPWQQTISSGVSPVLFNIIGNLANSGGQALARVEI